MFKNTLSAHQLRVPVRTCSGGCRANGVRAHIPGDSVTDTLSHRQVTGTLFWLGTLSHPGWDSSQSYWDKRAVVIIMRRGNEHSWRDVSFGSISTTALRVMLHTSYIWFKRTWFSHCCLNQISRNVSFACIEKRPRLLKRDASARQRRE